MTTPFGGQKSPLIIDLLGIHKGVVAPNTIPTAVSITTATTILEDGVVLDWSKITGTFYWNVQFGHVASSTAGNQMIRLVDFTNSSTVLASASSNISTDTSEFRSSIATTITFTKPAAVAKVGMYLVSNDTNARNMYLWNSNVLVV